MDEFIFHDDLQYTKQDWRNRNRIKTAHGPRWLTIPVGSSENRRICDVELPASSWAAEHWRRISDSYAAAPFFEMYRMDLEAIWRHPWRYLSDLNQHLIRMIASELLGMTTCFRDSRELQLLGRRQERVLEILEQTSADTYVSGPAAKAYIDPARFAERGISLTWKNYDGYPEYPQFHPPFRHDVTILDLLFHTGPDAAHYVWGWRTA